MTLEETIAAIHAADAVPVDALRAGVGLADDLADRIGELSEKYCRGVFLLPDDIGLLFYGLHILAAARHPTLLPRLLDIARVPEDELERLFLAHVDISLAQLMLSVWDGESDTIFAMIEHEPLAPDAKWALFDVLARLTFDGRIPRQRTVAFLERFERQGLAGGDDMVWWGWESAVTKLGLDELEPAVRRVWCKDIYGNRRDSEKEENLAEMRRAAADRADPAVFDEADVCAITDPAEAVAWVDGRIALHESWAAESAQQAGAEEADVTGEIRLTADEKAWLEGFLVSRQVPETALAFEALDGFLTALIIGPELVLPSEYLPEIWGTEDGASPVWDSMEQAQYFLDLLKKHWNAIAARRHAGVPIVPSFAGFSDTRRGREWAAGFLLGAGMRRSAWEPMLEQSPVGECMRSIIVLALDDPEEPEDRDTRELREQILDELPEFLRIIAEYWRHGGAAPRHQPVRSAKIGRNDLCPCGSSKKFKKCCRNRDPAAVH